MILAILKIFRIFRIFLGIFRIFRIFGSFGFLAIFRIWKDSEGFGRIWKDLERFSGQGFLGFLIALCLSSLARWEDARSREDHWPGRIIRRFLEFKEASLPTLITPPRFIITRSFKMILDMILDH